jgi:CrcB protein
MLFTVVFAGGAFGALTRYLLSGCFVLGLMLQSFSASEASPLLISFVTAGILGSFTTFSTFSVEALALFEAGRAWHTVLYITVSCLIGLASFGAGALLASRLS